MDNCETCCSGGAGGHCDNDMFLRFEDKLGNACQTRWLFNNRRWHDGNDGKNENDAFDGGVWDGWTWTDALCAVNHGFYVPNKVMLDVKQILVKCIQ